MEIKNKITQLQKGLKNLMLKISSGISRRKGLVAIGGVAAVVIIAASSFIHQPAHALSFGHKGFHHDVDDDGKLTNADAIAHAKERFAKMDKDSNGIVTSDELCRRKSKCEDGTSEKSKARYDAMLKLIDTNSDGEITEAEFVAQATDRFSKVDTDGNGELSDEERENAREVIFAERQKQRFQLMDADGNGEISEAEFEAFSSSYGKHGKRGKKGHKGRYHDDDDD